MHMPDRMTGTYDRAEVITSVQRRRRWTPEEKIGIVEETYLPGSSYRLWRVSMALLATSCSPGAG